MHKTLTQRRFHQDTLHRQRRPHQHPQPIRRSQLPQRCSTERRAADVFLAEEVSVEVY